MLDQMIQEFWAEVENLLVEKYHTPRSAAREDIRQYRERLASHGVTMLLYNAGEERIAEAIHNGGFRTPPPRPSAE
jgi:hypothetical protein